MVTAIVAGTTTVKVGLGPHSGTVNELGMTSDLLQGTNFSALYPLGITPLASNYVIDVNGVLTDGSGLGGTNFASGTVQVSVVYEIPNILTGA